MTEKEAAVKKPTARPSARPTSPANRHARRPLGAAMLSDLAWQEIAHSLRLSGRELQIVRTLFDDRTESAIAAELGVAHRTVHTHFERLHRKLAVTDRLQLVLRVLEEFLVLTVAPDNILPPLCAYRNDGRCPLGGSRPRGSSVSVPA